MIVVDDGSTCQKHVEFLKKIPDLYDTLDIQVKIGSANVGISKAKNRCIVELLKQDADFFFIAEDDLTFKLGWDEAYSEAHLKTGIVHFSHQIPCMKREIVSYNDTLVGKCNGLNGVFLTFNRNMIETIGGFHTKPAKWGHTHAGFTRRAIKAGFAPFYVDIVDSHHYLHLPWCLSVYSDDEKKPMMKVNRESLQEEDSGPTFCPLVIK